MSRSAMMAVVGIAAAALFFGLWRCSATESARARSNVNALLDTVQLYRTADSLSAASCATLQLTVAQMKQYRSQDAELIRSLGLRLRRVNSVASVATVGRYEVVVKADSNNLWRYTDPWISWTAGVASDTMISQIQIRDTIVQILHRVPRFKLLGIAFGCKGVRQEVISKNPHTQIVYADYVEIKR